MKENSSNQVYWTVKGLVLEIDIPYISKHSRLYQRAPFLHAICEAKVTFNSLFFKIMTAKTMILLMVWGLWECPARISHYLTAKVCDIIATYLSIQSNKFCIMNVLGAVSDFCSTFSSVFEPQKKGRKSYILK